MPDTYLRVTGDADDADATFNQNPFVLVRVLSICKARSEHMIIEAFARIILLAARQIVSLRDVPRSNHVARCDNLPATPKGQRERTDLLEKQKFRWWRTSCVVSGRGVLWWRITI